MRRAKILLFTVFGAICAVALIYRHKLFTFLKEVLGRSFLQRGTMGMLAHPIGLITIAFLATCVPAFLLRKVIGHNLESLAVISWALLVGGVVMSLG